MASARRWFTIVLIVLAIGLLGMCAIAGAGVYFVSQHVDTATVSAPDALTQFNEALARFSQTPPLLEIDADERVHTRRSLTDMPTADTKATTLVVMAWDPSHERMVHFDMPLWVLGIGRRRIDLGIGSERLDMRGLNIDVRDLERVGPTLVLDLLSPGGNRALVWTQ